MLKLELLLEWDYIKDIYITLSYGVAWIILSALGADDPGSNQQPYYSKRGTGESPGSPIFFKMAEIQKLGSVKRFGARYGRSVKHKLAKIEAIQKGKHQCPYCHGFKAKRLSVGIWTCGKCKAKFTGKAYSIKKVTIEEGAEEEEKKEEETKEETKEKEE